MKKYVLFVMFSMAWMAVGAQNFGAGIEFSSDIYNRYVEKADPLPSTTNKIIDSTLILKGYWFTPGILEFNGGLGFTLSNQEDVGDVNGDSVEEYIQFSAIAGAGANLHLIRKEYIHAGIGGMFYATLKIQPDGADAPEYSGLFNMLFEISLPVFLDILFTEHLAVRLSVDMAAVTVEHAKYVSAPDETTNINEVNLTSGVLQYGAVVSFIYRL